MIFKAFAISEAVSLELLVPVVVTADPVVEVEVLEVAEEDDISDSKAAISLLNLLRKLDELGSLVEVVVTSDCNSESKVRSAEFDVPLKAVRVDMMGSPFK